MQFVKKPRPARRAHTQASALRHALRRLGRAELAIVTGGVGLSPELLAPIERPAAPVAES